MKRAFLSFCCLLALGGVAKGLAPDADQAILPAHLALQRVGDEQALRGPPRDVSDQLVRLGELDQAPRDVLHAIDLSGLPPDERIPASRAMWKEIDAQDASDQRALAALLPPHGWFTADLYGAKASEAAWSVVQHATGNLALMRDALSRMIPAVHARLVRPDDYAMLSDRVAMLRGEQQTYGTQFTCVDHRWKLYPLADPAGVEGRRRALGMSESAGQEAARIAAYPPYYFAR